MSLINSIALTGIKKFQLIGCMYRDIKTPTLLEIADTNGLKLNG